MYQYNNRQSNNQKRLCSPYEYYLGLVMIKSISEYVSQNNFNIPNRHLDFPHNCLQVNIEVLKRWKAKRSIALMYYCCFPSVLLLSFELLFHQARIETHETIVVAIIWTLKNNSIPSVQSEYFNMSTEDVL